MQSVKIFGIFVSNSYCDMINDNWNFRFDKFKNALISWSSRTLTSINQRVEVVKTFALSRICYAASILPLRASRVKKIESLIGKFIWTGVGILRISMNDMKNDKLKGGFNLPCVASMNRALLSSQLIRLLKSEDSKSVSHVDFWMGPLLNVVFPTMGLDVTASSTPEYYSFLGDCLASLMVDDFLTSSSVE